MVRRRGGINIGRKGQISGNGQTRASSQFAFPIVDGNREYTLALFPIEKYDETPTQYRTYNLFPGLSPGMVIRVTGIIIDIASGSVPGACQYIDLNLAHVSCKFSDGCSPVTTDDRNTLGLQNDGTRNSPCFTLGAYGQFRQRIPMASNAQYCTLTTSRTTSGASTFTCPALGSLMVTKGFVGYCTVTVTYQVGASRVLASPVPAMTWHDVEQPQE